MFKSFNQCIITGLSAITSLFRTVENLAQTAEAHSEKYKTTALAELAASAETLERA